ncbi:MAG: methylenetetrahydrofolate reductase [Clostridium fessum]
MSALSHLTCVSSTREKVHSVLREIQAHGIENVLALRGDIPKDGKVEKDYQYASQLIREIRETCPDPAHRRSLLSGGTCGIGQQDGGYRASERKSGSGL